jgi:hypothetical protein
VTTAREPTWGTVTTVRAPLPQVLAFVAHHRALGAQRIWLFFDDPDDPAAAAVDGLSGVRVVRCTADHWARAGSGGGKANRRRPEAHQVRQTQNAGFVYRRTNLDWLLHLDVDEFLWPLRPVGRVLAEAPATAPALRLAPWEALHDPALPDDIFTARAFRRALKGEVFEPLRDRLFGPYAEILHQGAISHAAGKCFFRTGLPGLSPRIHTAMLDGERLVLRETQPEIALLHFHAQDRADWIARLPFRATRGAYRANPPFFVWFSGADAAEVAAFYDRIQVANPAMLAQLRDAGALIEADLRLRDRVARLAEQEGRTWAL